MANGEPSFKIPRMGTIAAFAIVIDINHSARFVQREHTSQDSVAQFTRDVLTGVIMPIETNGGHVVAFMGDAILAVMQDEEKVIHACFEIAKNVDNECEYISIAQREHEDAWAFSPGGVSLKIAIEYGDMDVSTISSRFLGEHRLFSGNAIVHAVRISRAGSGNRCLVGPYAAKKRFKDFGLEGPFFISGKRGEPRYNYYRFSMGDIWKEGALRKKGKNLTGVRSGL